MDTYKYIIIILVYRNALDLQECIESIRNGIRSFKIVIVNAYYDMPSYMEIKKVAQDYGCDFLNIENKGYSYGNNCGIKYARERYQFEYLIIANPDTIVEKFEDSDVNSCDVIAPNIVDLKGQKQNPASVVFIPIDAKLAYKGFKKNRTWMLLLPICINKIIRTGFLYLNKFLPQNNRKIYKAHGSFLLMKKRVVDLLFPIYDEKMFLFSEEDVLAYKLKREGISTNYTENMKIIHKEDGSIKKSNLSVKEEVRKSAIYFYEHYLRK